MGEETFKSLDWLRAAIRFVLEVVAALSILLLTLGLVSASWNFLDKDQIFGNAPLLQSLWGLDQALAIDANLPLVFVFLFFAVKNKDWVKTAIYTVIGGMLLFVAATILDMESLRQALNIPLEAAALQVHVSMGVITQVRSFATIGLVAMSGLTWTMLLVKKEETAKPDPAPVDPLAAPVDITPPLSTVAVVTPRKHTKNTGVPSNGHTPKEDMYTRYQEIISVTPTHVATAAWLSDKLGVSTSTISNYRKRAHKEHDELKVLHPAPVPQEAHS
jgi:hypothetical protein